MQHIKATLVQAERIMRKRIVHALKNGITPPNMMLTGAPGVGKSDMTNNLKNKIAEDLGISVGKIHVIDIRLAGMDGAEVQGIAYVSRDDQMEYSTPPWFPCSGYKGQDGVGIQDDDVVILFMDELTNAEQDAQHAAYRPILDRTVQNGTKMFHRTVIIAAGNRPEDNTGARKLKPALANRFAMIMDIHKIEEGFRNYIAQADNWDLSTVTFLMNPQNTSHILKPPSKASSELPFPTPRSWSYVSETMKAMDGAKIVKNVGEGDAENSLDYADLRIAIAGSVGTEAATNFLAHLRYSSYLPDWNAVMLNGWKATGYVIPTGDMANEKMYALAHGAALVCISLTSSPDVNFVNKANNLIDLVEAMPESFVTAFCQTIGRNPKAASALISKRTKFSEVNKKVKGVLDTLRS